MAGSPLNQLLVSADDFGLCQAVNEAVKQLHDRGIITTTTFVTNTDLFDRSAAELRALPRLNIGIHLNLTDGKPVLPPGAVGSLVNGRGEFIGGRHYQAIGRLVSGRCRPDQVHAEWRAQTRRAVEAGLRISHLSSHGHVHMVPALHAIVIALLAEFNIPYLRLCPVGDGLKGRLLARWTRPLRRRLEESGLRVVWPDRLLGIGHSGGLSKRALRGLLAEVAANRGGGSRSELIVHPSTGRNLYHRRWRYRGDLELAALVDPEIATALKARLGRARVER